MGKRAAIVTTVPKNREARIRRATKDDIRGQGIDGAIESYLAATGLDQSSGSSIKR
jgi:hypothetical protein